uniref:AfsR/SARP family transcriptional regulator n=1 Tax=Paractinoplanes polyasparticus TaxID=2856853 RepID=UPI001C848C47|nr:BTAD domain-containing putative transcriptional regulator [Actinoplanes polyasparticus]
MGGVQIRVLGPVRLGNAPIASAKQRALLAALALEPGEVVSRGTLVEAIWGTDAPGANAIQVQVSRLRARLDGDLVSVPDGYRLKAPTDLALFLDMVRRAASASPEQACALFGEALALWRGEVVADVESVRESPAAAAVTRQRLAAVVDYADAAFRLGRHGSVLAILYEATTAQPFDGPLHARLITALAGTGRQAAALEAYEGLRRRLADELGVDPDPAPRDAYLRILRTSSTPAPRHLPAATRFFTGRDAELRHLDKWRAAGTPVVAVVGTAGVGKTTLARHWALRAATHFPDGQLYADLRGFDPATLAAADPDEILYGFLDALGVPVMPVTAAARIALYRSTLAGRRVLIVLDNARDAAQVEPLLPSGDAAMTLVTSRNELAGLAVAVGAEVLALPLPTAGEASDLVRRRLRADRCADRAALDELVERCARLPVALAVVAARAARHPGSPLTVFAEELRAAEHTLDALGVAAVFACSYRSLSPAAARLFRVLPLHPGPVLRREVLVSLAGSVRVPLAELTGVGLVEEHGPGRYALHDLLRAYASSQASEADTPAPRRRLVDHYLHSASVADRLLHPGRRPLELGDPALGVVVETHGGAPARALRWFDEEQQALIALVRGLAAAGEDHDTWRVAWTLTSYLDRRGQWQSLVEVNTLAVAAAERVGDTAAVGRVLGGLARATAALGRYDDAEKLFLRLIDVVTVPAQRGHAHINVADLFERRERFEEALRHAHLALAFYRHARDCNGEASALNSIGWYNSRLGDHRRGLRYCRRALARFADLDDTSGEAATLDSVGFALHHLGRHAEAIECYERALTLYRSVGDRYFEADILRHLADSRAAGGDAYGARAARATALTILEELGHPAALDVRAALSGQ